MNESKPSIVTRPIDPKTITPRQVAETAAISLGRKPSEKGTERLAQDLGADADANARLIAAAPMLLSVYRVALNYVLDMTSEGETVQEKALRVALQHAIRKAEGGAA